MKRLTAITLALMLIFVFTVSAAAQDSPIGKQYYKIIVSSEGSGSATASANKVEKDTGDTVVFNSTPDQGFFTRWIIKGDYEILDDGTVEDPVITVLPHSDLDVTASFSVDPDYLYMFVRVETNGNGTASVDYDKVLKGSGQEVTFTAVEDNDIFVEWKFECEYTIVKGDYKSKSITIIPYTDIHAVAYFVQPTPEKPDDSDKAPRTGDPMPYVISFMAIALGAAVFATMKLKKAK